MTKKKYTLNHFGYQLEGFGYPLSKNHSQIYLVNKNNNFSMQFLTMNLTEQVVVNDRNEQVFF